MQGGNTQLKMKGVVIDTLRRMELEFESSSVDDDERGPIAK
jgi:hypothetical protein